MNELANSTSPTFQGKSHNNHPRWQDAPLRLTPAQTADPRLVIDDFFESYHLQELRETLWNWLVEVLSSPHGISGNPLERSNHIYFYEKIETLIEAAWLIYNDTTFKMPDSSQKMHSGKGDTTTTGNTPNEAAFSFNKDVPLMKMAPIDPKGVIRRIFHEESFEILLGNLTIWFNMAIACENSVYDDSMQREQLTRFYEELLPLLNALYELDKQANGSASAILDLLPEALRKAIAASERIRTVFDGKSAAPHELISRFFKTFPKGYITSEMDDWLAAGISYEGSYTQELTKSEVLETHRNILCLIKAAHALISKSAQPSDAGKDDSAARKSSIRRGVRAEEEELST